MVRRPLEGELLRQERDAALAGAVRRPVLERHDAHRGGEVDDGPAAGAHHDPRGGLRAKEEPLEVGVEDLVPLLLGHLERGAPDVDAGVVDENVDAAELRGGGGHRPPDRRDIADVQLDGETVPACFLDLAADSVQGAEHPPGDDEIGARPGEARGDAAAQAAPGARDDRHLPVQPERVHRRSLLLRTAPSCAAGSTGDPAAMRARCARPAYDRCSSRGAQVILPPRGRALDVPWLQAPSAPRAATRYERSTEMSWCSRASATIAACRQRPLKWNPRQVQ